MIAPKFPQATHGAQKTVSTGCLINLSTNISRAKESYDAKNKKNRTTCNCKAFMQTTMVATVRSTLDRCGDQCWYQAQLLVHCCSGLTGGTPHNDGIFDADVAIDQTLVDWLCKWSDDQVGYPIFHSFERDEVTPGVFTSVSLAF